jgi:hypothetical protein
MLRNGFTKAVSRAVGGSACLLPLKHKALAGDFDRSGAQLTEAGSDWRSALASFERKRLHASYFETAMTCRMEESADGGSNVHE